jgi:hypothetical protein
MESFGVISVRVSPPPNGPALTYALAWTTEDGEVRSAGLQQVRPDGLASFTLRIDRSYSIGAFTDTNGNRSYDSANRRNIKGYAALAQRSKARTNINATLVERHRLLRDDDCRPKRTPTGRKRSGLEVVSLDDKRFTFDARQGSGVATAGFLSNNRLGIYFTEPFVPRVCQSYKSAAVAGSSGLALFSGTSINALSGLVLSLSRRDAVGTRRAGDGNGTGVAGTLWLQAMRRCRPRYGWSRVAQSAR